MIYTLGGIREVLLLWGVLRGGPCQQAQHPKPIQPKQLWHRKSGFQVDVAQITGLLFRNLIDHKKYGYILNDRVSCSYELS